MKRLELRCTCGRTREFQGRDAAEVMNAIDASGWVDLPGGGKGWMPGHCDDCDVAENLDDVELTQGDGS